MTSGKDIPFVKMHGAGNDFVIVDAPDLGAAGGKSVWSPFAKACCHRHFGIGADQLLVIEPPATASGLFRMLTFNSDGSSAEICGNGIRCVAAHLRSTGRVSKDEFVIDTPAGPRPVRLRQGSGELLASVMMGSPKFALDEIPAKVPAAMLVGEGMVRFDQLTDRRGEPHPSLIGKLVSMGNPHCVVECEPAVQKLADHLGPQIERHPIFPKACNVHFVRRLDHKSVEAVIWERGSGATLACGSGACAIAVALISREVVRGPLMVRMPGGSVEVAWEGNKAATNPVWMTGPVAFVYSGRYAWQPS